MYANVCLGMSLLILKDYWDKVAWFKYGVCVSLEFGFVLESIRDG